MSTWMILIIGNIMVIAGIYFIIKSNAAKKFYREIKNNDNIAEYKKTVGTVICDAYMPGEKDTTIKAVTPIVEYIVDGEKYETMNRTLENGAELPVGTKMFVWYKKNRPNEAILGTELESATAEKIFGTILILLGIVFFIIAI